ncbi:MAG: tetratricopeptide repeat protein [Polyangiaceae bacterium]|nr:tetratricopeptide repeat protein [Polyangiaceae bacterium]
MSRVGQATSSEARQAGAAPTRLGSPKANASKHSDIRFSLAALVACVALSATTAAHAGEPERKQALELFEQSKGEYRAGRFTEAVALLEKAYALHPEPVLLYNLARAHEGLGEFAKAVEEYERYLTSATEIPDRGAIEQKVTSLKRTIEEQARLEKERDEAMKKQAEEREARPSKPVGPAPEKTTRSPSPIPWIVVGIGAGGLGAGIATGVLALSRNDEAEAAPSQQETVELRDEADTFALASTISFIAGGVVLGAGAIWGIVDVTVLSGEETPVSVSFQPGLGGVRFTGTF